MKKKLATILGSIILALLFNVSAIAQNSLCFPHLIEDSSLFRQHMKPDEVVEIINGPMIYQSADDDHYTKGFRPQNAYQLQGAMCQSVFDFSEGASSASIMKQLRSILTTHDYTVSFECQGTQCGDIPGWKLNLNNFIDGDSNHQRYVAAYYGNEDVHLASAMFHLSEFDSRPRLLIKAVVRPSFSSIKSVLDNRNIVPRKNLDDIGSVYFSSRLSDGYDATDLSQIAQTIAQNGDKDYIVIGYSDPQGRADENAELSHKRALQVVNDLKSSQDLNSARLWAIAGGELMSNTGTLQSSRKATIYRVTD